MVCVNSLDTMSYGADISEALNSVQSWTTRILVGAALIGGLVLFFCLILNIALGTDVSAVTYWTTKAIVGIFFTLAYLATLSTVGKYLVHMGDSATKLPTGELLREGAGERVEVFTDTVYGRD